ncbi:TonB-dependent receptor [Sphingomonas sp. RHCKR47]|nr:TonB-dependent receptor [Sphingomonas citricola]
MEDGMSVAARRMLLATGISIAALSSAPVALAQTTAGQATNEDQVQVPDQPDADRAPQGAAAGDIVVTARRRSESLNRVPVVVSVIGVEQIANNNANDLSKIGELTPTVIVGAYKSAGGGSIAIRGVSSPANQAGFEQAVSVAIDGVQTSDGRIAQLGIFDVAQVEVLKGPQALLFGKNNTAGVISIATADPTDRLEITGRAAYEFVGDEVTTEAAISGPLSDTFGARLAVRYRNLDGWLRNTAKPIANPFYRAATGAPAGAAQLPGASDERPGDQEVLARLTLKGEPSDNFSFRAKSFYAYNRDDGPGAATQNIGPCTGPNPRMYGIADPNADCVPDRRTTIGDLPLAIAATIRGGGDGTPYGKLTVATQAIDLGWSLGAIRLDSTTGYNYTSYQFLSGFDQTTYSQLAFYNEQKAEQFSQEFRVTSELDGAFNFMAGGFYQTARLRDANDTKLNDGSYNAAANRFSTYQDRSVQTGNTLSAFAQALIKPVDTLEIAGGARYTRERKRFRKQNVYGVGTFNTLNTVYPGSDTVGFLQGSFDDDNVSPEATVTWRPDTTKTLFVAYRTGFKSGGFGLTSPLQTGTRIGDADFESEKARGFEAGAKGLFLNGRLRVNVAAFAYKFTNLQVNTYDPARVAYTINNAGQVRQRGGELEVNYSPTSNFNLHGAIAYTHNRFRNFVGQCYGYAFPTGTTRATAVPPPNCSFVNATALTLQQDFGGRAPARSPDWAGNGGAEVTIPLGATKIAFTGDAFYSGSYMAAETMAPSTRQDAFWRFNASARLAEVDDRWAVSVIGRNLSNKYYLLYAADRTGGASVPGAIGEQRGVVARGREIALQVSGRF